MDREQITKALECCISGDDCTICPLCDEQSCPCVLNENALSLIKELTEENERLRAEIDNGAEVCHNCHTEYADKIAKAKADTVREMQEKLIKGAFCSACGIDYSHHIIQIAKEMEEEYAKLN